MKFKTIAEAFNHYRTMSVADMEKRAAEIKTTIHTDPAADVTAFNIELEGIRQAKENAAEKRGAQPEPQMQFNPIEGMELGNNRGNTEITDENVFDSAEYRTAFLKSLLGRELNTAEHNAYERAKTVMAAEKRADDFSTSTNTAAVLPTATLNEVISKARTMGGLLSVCRSFNMPSKLSIPVGTPRARAESHTEGAEVEAKRPNVVNISFDGHEIIEVFSISAKVRRMSIPAFESYLINELYACVMATVEYWLVSGSGTNEGAGIEAITWTAGANAVEYAAGGKPKYNDFLSAIALLKRGYSAGAHWAMNNATLYTHVYGVVDENKRPIFVADPKQESIGHILGKPIVIDDNIADGDIYLGNFQYMGYNFVETPVIEVSTASSFKKGLIDYRALAIADSKSIVQEAFVKLMEASGGGEG